MKKEIFLFILANVLFIGGLLATTTRYVSTTGSNTSPYTSLATAANSISTAIAACSAGDIIMVDNGTYILSNKIQVVIDITIKSINGNTTTIIDGNNSVKCFEISSPNAVVEGFTIQNAKNLSGFGGAVNIISSGTLRDCILKNNSARDGGGVALDQGGLVENCIIYNNTAQYGGGIRLLDDGEVRNCLVKENTATTYGGGVNVWNKGKVKNCVITKNTAPATKGAGIRTRNNGTVYNCIIYYNNGENYAVDGSGYHYYNSCSTPAIPGTYSSNCISSIPMFVDISPGSEDYHLQSGSTCIDAGTNFSWMNTVPDLEGNTRIVNTFCDMGPYEYFSPVVDTDSDGVEDSSDDYPSDPLRAFDNFFPSSGYATLAYEDLWPSKGDYDFNDLVLDYRFKTVTNASNDVVEIIASFTIKAFGAGFRNGFGFQFPNDNVNTSDLMVSGYNLQENFVTLAANGLEQGQNFPTIIVFDNTYKIMEHPGQGIGVNTEQWAPYVQPENIEVLISFNGNYKMADVDIENFNPFLIINKFRDDEVHLPDYLPTVLANTWQFGYADDDSNPANNRYYKTELNLPWAINIPESFDYPTEKTVITSAYLNFADWAESNGQLYPNWYQDIPGYRQESNIYQVP